MRQDNKVQRMAVKSPAPKNRIETPLRQTTSSKEDFCQKVQEKAYQLYAARGYAHGCDVEDWLLAEKMVKGS